MKKLFQRAEVTCPKSETKAAGTGLIPKSVLLQSLCFQQLSLYEKLLEV